MHEFKLNRAPIKELITFEGFQKLDIRVGTILTGSEVDHPCLALSEVVMPRGCRVG